MTNVHVVNIYHETYYIMIARLFIDNKLNHIALIKINVFSIKNFKNGRNIS